MFVLGEGNMVVVDYKPFFCLIVQLQLKELDRNAFISQWGLEQKRQGLEVPVIKGSSEVLK